jgi:hypothetical protein
MAVSVWEVEPQEGEFWVRWDGELYEVREPRLIASEWYVSLYQQHVRRFGVVLYPNMLKQPDIWTRAEAICPSCERKPKIESDYLCEECRYG